MRATYRRASGEKAVAGDSRAGLVVLTSQGVKLALNVVPAGRSGVIEPETSGFRGFMCPPRIGGCVRSVNW